MILLSGTHLSYISSKFLYQFLFGNRYKITLGKMTELQSTSYFWYQMILFQMDASLGVFDSELAFGLGTNFLGTSSHGFPIP